MICNFQCRRVLLIWIIVGQSPTVLAVGARGGCVDIFSLLCRPSFFPSRGDGSIQNEIHVLSERAVNLKTTNQATKFKQNISSGKHR